MIFPTIHLNGTSRESLLEDYCAALSALRYAQEKLCAISPNARDYYVAGDDAFRTALGEHRTRIEKAVSLISEVEAITEHIADS